MTVFTNLTFILLSNCFYLFRHAEELLTSLMLDSFGDKQGAYIVFTGGFYELNVPYYTYFRSLFFIHPSCRLARWIIQKINK